jgi:ABC-2 type transport system ATP-binding protein
MSAIVATALTKRFGARSVLEDLELNISPGSIYGLLGRNGAGKTTLMKLAMGLLLPSSGEVRVLGNSLGEGGSRDKENVGYVAERSLLPPWMSVGRVLRFESAVKAKLDSARAKEYLQQQGLDLRRSIKSLSKGQQKRLDLELALAADPRVLLLDEPFDGLDPVSRAEAMEALVTHVGNTGASVLTSSHILGDLERICDRIGILSSGKIAFESELDPLKESVAVVCGTRPTQNGALPINAQVIGSRADERGKTWLVRGLDRSEEEQLRRNGFQLSRPGLDELGLELMRCL